MKITPAFPKKKPATQCRIASPLTAIQIIRDYQKSMTAPSPPLS